jgi:selenium metabolism protein YedF
MLPFSVLLAQGYKEDSAFLRDNYIKREVRIPMRDGALLFTAIYLPKDSSNKYPFLMVRTPYSVAPYGTDKFPYRLGPNAGLMKEKYIFIYQDVRGRYMSEGDFEEMTPHKTVKKTAKETDESSDTYDTIEWLLKNFVNTLVEVAETPDRMLFVNTGVFLTTEGSEVLEALEMLGNRGVEIASCGVCLDFFNRRDKLRSGTVTNMFAIAESLLKAGSVIRL